ncbi:conjugative transfer region protein TrbK [Bradyrhizobium japonicum]|jgi:conjugative transfer region protein TrbK|uniref:putative entry exclusion protein TrbK-alt n=1 Tax=Bradyrhizobium TaxID=374 RepID=UPI0003765864|nr:putative entry exclusion protein TrbK-alt [Bradyrhizobium elkanii]MCP1732687.1 conjugative transfer region protein TrbK [Bradyrhizobium elkanii]MCS3568025.1 conjugative transfer region protein TrbK [Bradyrhizobium elkanii]MCS3590492.1 conjugative transfer region protein TrbK [Bradyrhizobium elkanii]MCS3619935.1 conjugative transfer region protein TrbK [Bradyrhizobium elkanii]MCW2111815.1 conjugative transfer region protein TrbK [Bradyrhizobium elkanii]
MTDVKAFKALSLLTTIGLVAVAACTIQLRGGDDSSPAPKAEQTNDATNSDLARCRGVTPEEAGDYQHCHKIWAENRRRFFGKKDGAAALGHDDSASPIPAPKGQNRIPQGYPNLPMPEASKP